MRFEEILQRYQSKELTSVEAADILGMSARNFLRKRVRYEEEGKDIVFDKRLGKASGRKAQEAEIRLVTKLYEERYKGFSVKHFYSFARHKIRYSYTWYKNTLEAAGLIEKTKRGGPHRQRRERKPMAGMMLHQDGSTHRWIPALDYNIDLIITMDDATSEIVSAFFVLQEGTESSLQGVKETIMAKGLFCSLYTDRGSHYAYTRNEGEKIDRSVQTQVQRALKELGIRHIAAYSPQARGRSERMFGTLQNRLPKELELFNIRTIARANHFLKSDFIPRFNKEFSVAPKEPKSVYIPWVGCRLDDVLCIKEDRIVHKDNTVRYNGLILQIPPNSYRHHYVKAEVEVHEYLDKNIGIFYGHQNIGTYNNRGELLCVEPSISDFCLYNDA